MLVARTSVGKEDILIEAVADKIEIAGEVTKRQTEPTAIEDILGQAYERVKVLIGTIAADFATTLKATLASGQKIEMEFSLGLSASSGLWVISGKGEAGIKVKMVWEETKG